MHCIQAEPSNGLSIYVHKAHSGLQHVEKPSADEERTVRRSSNERQQIYLLGRTWVELTPQLKLKLAHGSTRRDKAQLLLLE